MMKLNSIITTAPINIMTLSGTGVSFLCARSRNPGGFVRLWLGAHTRRVIYG